jgi:hypothetical protein
MAHTKSAYKKKANSELQEQIAALKAAETRNLEAPRKTYADGGQVSPPPLPDDVEGRIAYWAVHHVMTPQQQEFLIANPGLALRPNVAAIASAMAHQAGHEINSQNHFNATKANFQSLMEQMEQAERPQQYASGGRVPELHDKPHTPARSYLREPKPEQKPASRVLHSAPVSRSIPDGSYRPLKQRGKVHLTAEERQIARVSGISDEEYARNKMLLQDKKASGEIQN